MALWSDFESVTTDCTGGELPAGQSERTPTKPAALREANAFTGIIMLGSFRQMA